MTPGTSNFQHTVPCEDVNLTQQCQYILTNEDDYKNLNIAAGDQ